MFLSEGLHQVALGQLVARYCQAPVFHIHNVEKYGVEYMSAMCSNRLGDGVASSTLGDGDEGSEAPLDN